MRGLVLFAVLAACSHGGGAPAPAGTRIVSLMPTGTEIVAALGASSQLVGVDQYSDYPDAVKQLPRVGNYISPDIEAIVRLHPSLVVLDDVHGQVAATLHDRGIASIGCAIQALPDVEACLRAVGARLGRAHEADAAIAAIDRAMAAARAHPPAHRPEVLVVIGREPAGLGDLVAAGPGSYADELVTAAGGANALAQVSARYAKIGSEEVLRARPEVILDLSLASDHGAAWSGLDVPAVTAGRVRMLDASYLLHPSPRVERALADVAAALR